MSRVLAKEDTLSEILGVSTRRIRDVCRDAKVSPGKYNLVQALKLYMASTNATTGNEALELKKVEKELKEYKLAIMKNEYHHRDDIKLLLTDTFSRFKSKLASIPKKGSLELLGQENQKEIEVILEGYINQALEEFSEYPEEVGNGKENKY